MKSKIVTKKHKSNTENKRKLIYSQAHVTGTDHHIPGSSCDQKSPARRTINEDARLVNNV